MDIKTLVNETFNSLLTDSHLKQSATKRNYQAGFNFVIEYGRSFHNCDINDAFFNDCLESMKVKCKSGHLSEAQFKKYKKCIFVLKQYAVHGTTHYERLPNLDTEIPSERNERVIQEFLNTEFKVLEDSTLKTRRNILRQMLIFLERNGLSRLESLTAMQVSLFMEYISTRRPAGLSTVVPAVRAFVYFLFKEGITRNDLSHSALVKVSRKHKIGYAFTVNEMERILACIDKGTAIGKRDWAIMLLSSRNGLRGSDILNLKLTDIHWKEAEIVIVQKKTSASVVCPIDAQTGDALADYILNARPDSCFQNVFLSDSLARPFTSVDLCLRLKKYMTAAGVEKSSAGHVGMHAFRRGLGTALLENDVELETIAQILGHKSTAATKQYLSISERKLACCTLPMPCYSGRLEASYV